MCIWVIFTCFISSGSSYTRNGSPYPTGAAATKRKWTLYERRASTATESKVGANSYCVEVTASNVSRGFWGGGDDTGRVGYITISRSIATHTCRRRRMVNGHWAPVLLGGRVHRRRRRRRRRRSSRSSSIVVALLCRRVWLCVCMCVCV